MVSLHETGFIPVRESWKWSDVALGHRLHIEAHIRIVGLTFRTEIE